MAKAFRRRNYITKKDFQTRFALPFLLASAVANIVPAALFILLARNKIDGFLYSMQMPHASAGALLSTTAFLASIVAVAIVSVMFLWASRGLYQKIAGPLFHIRTDLQKIAAGDLCCQVTPRKNDEFKDFAGEINTMVKALNSRFTILRDSTDDLAKAARALNTLPKNAERGDLTQRMRRAIKSLDEQTGSFKL